MNALFIMQPNPSTDSCASADMGFDMLTSCAFAASQEPTSRLPESRRDDFLDITAAEFMHRIY